VIVNKQSMNSSRARSNCRQETTSGLRRATSSGRERSMRMRPGASTRPYVLVKSTATRRPLSVSWVAVLMLDADDDPLSSQPTEVVGGATGPVCLVETVGHEPRQAGVVEPGEDVTEAADGGHERHHPLVPETQAGGVEAVGVVRRTGHLLQVTTSGTGRASFAWASSNRRLADWPTARRACQFSAFTRRPIPKSLVSEITVSVRSARCSYWVSCAARYL
jgi:hypothetical protein